MVTDINFLFEIGCTKKMKISRKVFQADGTSRKEDKVLTIDVKAGWKSGTKITFQREGDQTPNKIPADIVFIIRDKPHSHFKRDGSDLRYTVKISLTEVRVNHNRISSSFCSKLFGSSICIRFFLFNFAFTIGLL